MQEATPSQAEYVNFLVERDVLKHSSLAMCQEMRQLAAPGPLGSHGQKPPSTGTGLLTWCLRLRGVQ